MAGGSHGSILRHAPQDATGKVLDRSQQLSRCLVNPPATGLKKICSGTYIVTQADVDTGERNNTASVTYESPDKRRIESAQSNTVAVTGSSAVSIGEARFH